MGPAMRSPQPRPEMKKVAQSETLQSPFTFGFPDRHRDTDEEKLVSEE